MSGADQDSQAAGDEGATDQMQEQQAGTEAVFPDLKLGEAWGDTITKGRAAELEQRLQAWEQEAEHGKRKGPFDNGPDKMGLHLTGADVFWLVARTRARTSEAQVVAEQMDSLRRHVNGRRARVSVEGLHLEHADLGGTHLDRAELDGAHLEEAILVEAQVEGALLANVHLDRALLNGAWLAGSDLSGAHLADAVLRYTHLEHSSLAYANLSRADLGGAHLDETILGGAMLERANLAGATLERADLAGAQMVEANLVGGQVMSANLHMARLARANLIGAQLEGADLRLADLAEADLRMASFDNASRLNGARLENAALDQVIFDNTNLTVIQWKEVRRLGDERLSGLTAPEQIQFFGGMVVTVEQPNDGRASGKNGTKQTSKGTRTVSVYSNAARAYRSLSLALRAQGLTADASRFHYRAEVMGRRALFHRTRALFRQPWLRYTPLLLLSPSLFVPWLLSWLFGTLAGYGVYHIWRLFLTYLGLVMAFAVLFFVLGQQAHLTLPSALDSVALSVSAFHGRGIQPSAGVREDMLWLAGLESVVGLMVEGLFIAALTRRVTGS